MPKKPIFGEYAMPYSCRLYSWEKESVKEFIKKLRDKKRKELKRSKNGKSNKNK